jgi:ParB family chromosome partitioning protein
VSALARSIAEIGLLTPIILSEGYTLVAGNRRLEACKSLGWTAIPATVLPLTALQAKLVEIDENLQRQDLTALERAEQLAERKQVYEALHPETRQGAQGRRGSGGGEFVSRTDTVSFSDATAEQIGATARTVRRAVQIADAIPEDVRDTLRNTAIADRQTDLLALSRMDEPRQREIANLIAEGQADTVAQAQREYQRQQGSERVLTVAPAGKYKAIVIDPPWPVQKIIREERPNQVEFDYPIMSLEEIAALPIPDLADNGCHVYLWVTHKYLPAGLALFQQWGVKYQCLMTWVKNVGFTPFSWMYSTEHVLFGRVGSLPLLEMGLRLDFQAKVREHSRKPDEFYDLVCRASPVPRLEMFSREARDGFVLWGNEVDRFSCPMKATSP